MSIDRFIGSPLARAGTVVLVALSAGLALASDGGPRWAFWASVGSGVVAFMFLVHSFAGLFSAWMRFAEALQAVVIKTLFSACYLLIVPIFAVVLRGRDPLRRRRGVGESSWVPRTGKVDASSLERMG
jgi:hypothetical protein